MKSGLSLLIGFLLVSSPMWCMNLMPLGSGSGETISLSAIHISDLKSLVAIAGNDLREANEEKLNSYIIAPVAMAQYMRHSLNLEGEPTKQEIDYFANQQTSEKYSQLTCEVLRQAGSDAVGTKDGLPAVIRFYAKKIEGKRVASKQEIVVIKKCIPLQCIGFLGSVAALFLVVAGFNLGLDAIPLCRH